MGFPIAFILILSICHASVNEVLENYPFSPNRKYGSFVQQSTKKLEEIKVVGYVEKGTNSYLFLRSEGKLKKVKVGEEINGMKLIGLQRGFLLLGDGDEIKRVKISWDRSMAQDRKVEGPGQKKQDEVQSPPPKQLLELLQDKK